MARLFAIQHAEDFVGGTSRFVVGKRARIEWNRSAEKLCRKGSPFFGWQSIECVKQLACFAAHILRLDPPVWGSKLSIWHPLGHPGDRDNPCLPNVCGVVLPAKPARAFFNLRAPRKNFHLYQKTRAKASATVSVHLPRFQTDTPTKQSTIIKIRRQASRHKPCTTPKFPLFTHAGSFPNGD